MIRILLISIAALLASGCAHLSPLDIPREMPFVAVKDWQFRPGAPFPQVTAHHAFIDFRDESGQNYRLEVRNRFTRDPLLEIDQSEVLEAERHTRKVNLRTLVTGPKALRIQKRLRQVADEYMQEANYVVVPGPNSNTFVETLIRKTPELSALLPHACVGKDFYSTLLVGVPGSNDGIELEAAGVIGAEIGLSKGAELHLMGLTFGVSVFPPSIKLPGLAPIGWERGTKVDRSEWYEAYPPNTFPPVNPTPLGESPKMQKADAVKHPLSNIPIVGPPLR